MVPGALPALTVVYFLGAWRFAGFDAFTSDNATEEEVKEGFRRIMLAVAACIVAVLAQIAFHVFVVDGFHWSSLLPAFLHVAAIGVLLLAPRRG